MLIRLGRLLGQSWGLILLQAPQAEPVRLERAAAAVPSRSSTVPAAVAPQVDWDETARGDLAVFTKHWHPFVASSLRGVWWYFLLEATCKPAEDGRACWVNVRAPAPTRGRNFRTSAHMSVFTRDASS